MLSVKGFALSVEGFAIFVKGLSLFIKGLVLSVKGFALSVEGAFTTVGEVLVAVVIGEAFTRELTLATIAETAFFTHSLEFGVGFHLVAFGAEIFEFTIEGDEFAEFAVERTIVERNAE